MPSERKNMEGRERKKFLKTSILFLCRSLASVGVGSISPEDVRQAKFNEDGPRIQLWKALHDLWEDQPDLDSDESDDRSDDGTDDDDI